VTLLLTGGLGVAPTGTSSGAAAPAYTGTTSYALVQPADVLTESDTGTDVSLLSSELTGAWTIRGDDVVLAEQLLRRLTTDRGTLDFSPDDGIDIRDELRDDMDATDVFQTKQRIENELLKDERVEDVEVTATFLPGAGGEQPTLQLAILVTRATGPFRLVLSVSDLTVELLSAEVA
jgi:hypothetical protein